MKKLIRMVSAIALFAGSYTLAAQEVSGANLIPSQILSVLDHTAQTQTDLAAAPIAATSVAAAQETVISPTDTPLASPDTASPAAPSLVVAEAPSQAATPVGDAPVADVPVADNPTPDAPVRMAETLPSSAVPVSSGTVIIPVMPETAPPPAATPQPQIPVTQIPVTQIPAAAPPSSVQVPIPPRTAPNQVVLPEQRYANPVLVTKVQEKLAELGFDPGPADGIINDRLRAAIKSFQSAHNLTPNGWVTTYLLAEIERLQAPTPSQDAPLIVMPDTTPPAPKAEMSTWSIHDLLDKTAHAASGDRLGPIQDAVIGADGRLAHVMVHVNTLYGDPNGTSAVAWDQLHHNMALPVIMTRLGGVKASKMREYPQDIPPEAGQWKISDGLAAKVEHKGQVFAGVKTMIFDHTGALQRIVVQADEFDDTQPTPRPSCQIDVMVEKLAVDWANHKLVVPDEYQDSCLTQFFPPPPPPSDLSRD